MSAILSSMMPGMMVSQVAHSSVEGCGQAIGSRHARSPWKRSVRQDYNLCLVPLGFFQAKNSHCCIRHIKEMAGGWQALTQLKDMNTHSQFLPNKRTISDNWYESWCYRLAGGTLHCHRLKCSKLGDKKRVRLIH